MLKAERKAALTAWKEEKRRPGLWLLRCEASGEAWVGATQDLDAARNRMDFALVRGAAPMPAMKSAMAAHGPAAFRFEELETLEEVEPIALPRELKERRAAAAERLGAKAV